MSNITLTIPNDDTIALRQFGKALIEIASAKEGYPVDVTVTPLVISTDVDIEERLRVATEELQQAAPRMMQELRIDGTVEIHGKRKEPEVDTTAQQVESLATNVNLPEPQVSDATTDSTGIHWDERIHSTSKALNADGTWRLRRKPKDMGEAEWTDYINETLYEIKPATTSAGKDIDKLISEIDTAGTHGEDLGDIEPPVTPPGDDFHTDTDVVTEQTVAGIPPIPVPPPVVVAPPVTEQWDFPRLMTFLTERHGKIDVATVNTLLAQDGMSSVQELNAHQDKIGPFVARVKAHLGESV